MKKTITSIILLCLVTAVTTFAQPAENGKGNVVPLPRETKLSKGYFTIPSSGLTFALKKSDPALTELLESYGWSSAPWREAAMRIDASDTGSEAYRLRIEPRRITIESKGSAGAFYGIQTLRQMMATASGNKLECGVISDAPRFPYRGLHFDVSRHFRPISFLKKQIDAMAYLKLNRMHLHLTDGAGWRMQIDSFPRLTSYAAWRPQLTWSEWVKNGAGYCDGPGEHAYGGYYTKDELRDLVDYAAKRHITVIPEIEMPGHSGEVTAAYPELGCHKDGNGEDLCPGKESTFAFLEQVLKETMDVFPSHYIHIGGDEASKEAWKNCPDCKKRMLDEGLSNVDELQSYLVKRIERFINANGRRMIGWDEILQGGLAPDATVMSWRGTEGGLQAISEGHDVIMTPGEFCYLDYSQDAPFREPVSIGGYTPLSKVYSYEPVDPSLSAEDAAHLLGVQGNLWSEYIPDDSHAEHMYYPRAYAIAEIGWSSPEKNYDDFHRRSLAVNDQLSKAGYKVFDLAGEYGERRESLTPVNHLALGAKVTYPIAYSDKYKAGGDTTLTDGIRGGWTYGDRRWQGWAGDADIIVDLGEVRQVHSADASFMHSEGAWVHLPEKVTWSVSADGKNFREIGTVWCDVDPSYPKIMFKSYGMPFGTSARYIRLQAEKNPRPGAWLFLDEIVVE